MLSIDILLAVIGLVAGYISRKTGVPFLLVLFGVPAATMLLLFSTNAGYYDVGIHVYGAAQAVVFPAIIATAGATIGYLFAPSKR